MTYELAKELKDAGFPQRVGVMSKAFVDGAENYILRWPLEDEREYVYSPTLSELIEACGEKFETLQRIEDTEIGAWWRAYPTEAWWAKQEGECWDMDCCGYKSGDTPEEAVARLWLALNKTT